MTGDVAPKEGALHRQTIIIGAGPGGLQLAYFLEKRGLDHVVLEGEARVAAFFAKFPRHRRLISINKPHTGFEDPETNLRWDWHSLLEDDLKQRFTRRCNEYFPRADKYVAYLQDFAERNAIDIVTGAKVVSITRPHGRFLLACADGRVFTADNVVVATGLSSERRPDFPGAEHAELYGAVSTDPAAFSDQRVLILGKGNAAFETANNLVESAAAVHLISPSPVRLAVQSGYVGHLRGMNAAFRDTHSLRAQNSVIDGAVSRIERTGDELQVDFAATDARAARGRLTVDRVIACLGFTMDAGLFGPGCRPQLCHDDRYPVMTSAWEAANVPHLHFAGNLMHARDFRRASSGFVHGFRFNLSVLADILRHRAHGTAWETYDIEATPAALAEFILHRADTAASLFNQPGFFCDAAVLSPDGRRGRVYQDISLDYFRDVHASAASCYTLTLEFGAGEAAPAVAGGPAGRSILHPVVRRVVDGRRASELHLPEELDGRWHKDDYVEALIRWLERDLKTAMRSAQRAGGPIVAVL